MESRKSFYLRFLILTLVIALAWTLTACSKDGPVVNEEIKVSFGNGKHTGMYTGNLTKGVPDGNGKFVVDDGSLGPWSYDGEWVQGAMTGEGTQIVGTNEFQGTFENGRLNGYGKYIKDGKLVYEGDMKTNNPHGQGILYNGKGEISYEGTFSNGSPDYAADGKTPPQ